MSCFVRGMASCFVRREDVMFCEEGGRHVL